MRITVAVRRAASVSVLAGAGAAFAASPALAAKQPEVFTCGGQTIVVSATTSNANQNGGWGTAQIVSGGTGVGSPVAVSGTVTDTTTGGPPVFSFSPTKGQGNAEQNQQTITCTEKVTTSAANFFGSQLPPGVSPSDGIELDLTATVVLKGQSSINSTG